METEPEMTDTLTGMIALKRQGLCNSCYKILEGLKKNISLIEKKGDNPTDKNRAISNLNQSIPR